MKTSKQTRWGLFADSCTSQPVHKPRVVWTNFILLPRVTLFVALFVIPLVLVGLGVFGTPTANATAGINQDLSFQGKIVNSSGTNITDGTYNMEFKIYSGCTNEPTNNTGCTLVWTEDDLVSNSDGVSFTSGTYQVNLGQYCPFSGGACTPSNANDGNTNSGVNWDTYPLYLSLQIGSTSSCSPSGNDFQTACTGDGEMDPYILLTSTPYSMNSNEVGGDTLSQLGVLAANQTWTGTNTFEIGSTNALTIQNASGYNELNENTTGNTLTLGNVTSTAGHGVAGNLALADGSTDNYSVTVDTATLSNSYTLSIPATGASGAQCLESSSGSTTSATTLQFTSCSSSSGTYVDNETTAQSANLNVQAATSGTVAGKFEANASGSGDILDLLNGSSVNVASISNTGAVSLSGSGGSGGSPSISAIADWPTDGTHLATLTVSPSTVGDVMVLMINEFGAGTVSGVSGGGVTTWNLVTTDSSVDVYVYEGTVTSTGSHAITWTNGGSVGTNEIIAQEFNSALEGSSPWSVIGSNTATSSSGASFTFPSITSTTAGELYWGFAVVATDYSAGTCSTGFNCTSSPETNVWGYNADVAASTAYAPTASQTGTGGATESVAIMLKSGAPSVSSLTVNGTTDLDTSSSTALVVQNSSYNTLTVNTSSDQVILGSGTGGESSPSLLVLDSGTNSTDPTEVNGALYYNSSMNMFRCGENGAWVDCVGGILGTNSAAGTASNTCTTACTALDSVAIPANYCHAGRTVTIYASGVFGTYSTGPTLSMQFYRGTSTTEASDTAIGAATPTTAALTASLSAVYWSLSYTFICYSTTSWDGQGIFTYSDSTTAAAANLILGTANTDSTSVPTTAFNLYLFPTWGTSKSANTITANNWVVTGN